MADEITREEKTSIAKEFLKYSPPGEFNNVHEDISVILNEKLNNIPGILETSLDYHQDQLTSVFANSEKQDKFLKFQASKLNKNAAARMQEFGQNSEYSEFLNQSSNCQGDTLISAQAHVEGNTFYDPKNSNIFDFDPISQVISNVRPAPANVKGPASAEPLRTALNTETNNYVKHHYPKGVGSVLIRNENDQSENAEEFKEFIILIEDHEFQPQNRWNGKWRSECMVTVARDGNIYLQGGAKVHVHYYEDSNVQLVTRQSYDQILIDGINSSSSDTQIAQGVLKIIKKLESRYQSSLRDNYVTMDDTTFKSLRRKLPMNRMRFDWDNLNRFRIGKEIEKE